MRIQSVSGPAQSGRLWFGSDLCCTSSSENLDLRAAPRRHFTPDGYMVESIGEAIAAYHYGITPLAASAKRHDEIIGERRVPILRNSHLSEASKELS